MPFKASCPNCNARLTVKEALIGKSVPCPQCKASFRVTDPADSTEMDSDVEEYEASSLPPALPAKQKSADKSKTSRGPSAKDKRAINPAGLWPIAGVVSVIALLMGGLCGYFIASARTRAGSAAVQGAGEVSVALNRMLKLLKDGNDRDFLQEFAPLEELRKMQQADNAKQKLPKVPGEILIPVIKGAISQRPEMTADGKTASFLPTSGKLIDPAWQPGLGYEGDVKAVIKAAIADIEKGEVKTIIRNLFPPDALQAMLTRSFENSPLPLIEKESALITLMLRDLRDLETKEPKITDDVAEFTLPAINYPPDKAKVVRPGAEHYSLQPRVIRFSQINGRWRFYDDGSLRKTGMIEGTGTRLQLERNGSSWRLSRYP